MSASTDHPARTLWRLVEPLHVVTYFSPEPVAALKQAGYKGFWMGYFAGRAAPLGEAPAELVQSTFFNFAPEHVARAIPDAWGFAPPASALDARLSGSVAALDRCFAGAIATADVARAADLAMRAAEAAPVEGRPLFAANVALPAPLDPLARLWHAATLLREHRGDGHLIALGAHEITGRQSHVFHAAALGTSPEVYAASRTMTREEWSEHTTALGGRGLLDEGGTLTAAGVQLHTEIEALTDRLAASALVALDDAEFDELCSLLQPMAESVIASGDLPHMLPTGLGLE